MKKSEKELLRKIAITYFTLNYIFNCYPFMKY